jgi:endonuclease G
LNVLENRGYLVGYDEEMRNPAWVAYRLEYRAGGETEERPSGFDADSRTRARVDHDDYTHSGYDRGHMAPNYLIGMVFGAVAQEETFLMSNIVPQLPDLNRGPWKDFEQTVAREYLPECEELWIITGPIYSEPVKRLSSGVAVPVAFYKILVDVVGSGQVRALALVMPQEGGEGSLKAYLVSVDQVEAVTGLDFLSLLEDGAEEQLEASEAARLW